MSDQPENQLDFDAAYGRHRREYQSIRVPLGLETRIKARARELPPGKGWIRIWRPLTAVAALALGLVAVSPLLKDNSGIEAGTPPLPSLAALSRSLPAKPSTSMPSFSQLKTLPKPRLPSRPMPTEKAPQSRDPRLFTESLFADVEEKTDENA